MFDSTRSHGMDSLDPVPTSKAEHCPMVDSAVPWWTTTTVLVTFDTVLSNSYMQSAGNSSCTVSVQLRLRLGVSNGVCRLLQRVGGVKKPNKKDQPACLSDFIVNWVTRRTYSVNRN